MAEQFNNLEFDITPEGLNWFGAKAKECCELAKRHCIGANNWQFREDDLTDPTTHQTQHVFFFRCTDASPSFEVSMGMNPNGKMAVFNVVPLEIDQLTPYQYNQSLYKFYDHIILSYNRLCDIDQLKLAQSKSTLDRLTDDNWIVFDYGSDRDGSSISVHKSAIAKMRLQVSFMEVYYSRTDGANGASKEYSMDEFEIVIDTSDKSKFQGDINCLYSRQLEYIKLDGTKYFTLWPTNDNDEIVTVDNPYQLQPLNRGDTIYMEYDNED